MHLREVAPIRRKCQQRRDGSGQRCNDRRDRDRRAEHLIVVKEPVVEKSRQQRAERQAKEIQTSSITAETAPRTSFGKIIWIEAYEQPIGNARKKTAGTSSAIV